MKTKMILGIGIAFLLFQGHALAGDRLGASEAELENLKALNQSGAVVTESDAELRKFMVGKWTTGRHEYIYRADGTWRMLPLDISTTHGKWRIENHQLIEEIESENGFVPTGARTFIQVSSKQLVLRNEAGPYPFRYLRIE